MFSIKLTLFLHLKKVFLLTFIFLSNQLFASETQKPTEIRIASSNHINDTYFLSLLKLALDHSKAEFGPYKFVDVPLPMLQQRAIAEVIDNRLDVLWTMTSPDREDKLKAIRIPALKGLGGFRIFLIRSYEQTKFDKITNEAQLKTMVAGQGINWPDSDILLDNGYKLIQALDHNTLMKMLRFKRFDYMPRSVHEIWAELALSDELVVENTLAMYYPSPFYFFVNKNNTALYNRINIGLHKAIENGSFNTFFENHPSSKDVLRKAKLNDRKIFKLKNRFMTNETKAVMANEIYIFKP